MSFHPKSWSQCSGFSCTVSRPVRFCRSLPVLSPLSNKRANATTKSVLQVTLESSSSSYMTGSESGRVRCVVHSHDRRVNERDGASSERDRRTRCVWGGQSRWTLEGHLAEMQSPQHHKLFLCLVVLVLRAL